MDIERGHIEAAYEFLRRLPPFSGWHLPPSSAVTFKATRHTDRFGDYLAKPVPTIRVSSRQVAHMSTLLAVVAHEMVHMKQDADGKAWRGSWHDAVFSELAEEVCMYLGLDPKAF